MKVHRYEKAFLGLGGVLLVACAGVLTYATLGMGFHLPGHEGQLDPKQVYTTPPFDKPGVRQLGENRYEVVLLGQMWNFSPAEVTVPVGAEITFTGTSADVIHGFNVEGTRVNMMLIPGQISRVHYRFTKPGEYLVICHEYCGLAHHTMSGKVYVK